MSLNPLRLQKWSKFFPNPEDAIIISKYEKYIDKAMKKDQKTTLHEFFLEQYLKEKGWFGHHAKILEDGERLLYNYIEFVKISLEGKVFLKDLKQKFDKLNLKYLRMILRITDKNSSNLLPDWYLAPQPLSFENGDLKKLGLLPEQKLLKRLLKRHEIKRQSPTFGTPAIQEWRKFRTGAVTGEKMVPVKMKRHKSSGGRRRSKRKKRSRKRRGGVIQDLQPHRPHHDGALDQMWNRLRKLIEVVNRCHPNECAGGLPIAAPVLPVAVPVAAGAPLRDAERRLGREARDLRAANAALLTRLLEPDSEEETLEGGGRRRSKRKKRRSRRKTRKKRSSRTRKRRGGGWKGPAHKGGHWTRKKRGDPIFRHHAHPAV